VNEQLLVIFSNPLFSFILLGWLLVWKGLALWKAATKRQLIWFILLSVIQTFGLLEILYLFWLSRYPIDRKKRVLSFLDEKIGKKVRTP
jgi:hypothetical protein